MDFDEYEKLPTTNFLVHMTAGAIAGVMEHCIMYPFDSIKTRMQSLSPQINYSNPIKVFNLVVRQEGLLRLFKGVSVVAVGAGPAHAMYFSVYELLKGHLTGISSKSSYIAAGVSGMLATFLHDGVMTPTEVVKQRLQMYNSPYKSILDCIRRTYKTEGIRAFYRSYTTQLSMNIPFQIVHFMTYEKCQNLTNKERVHNPLKHMISGGVAGGVAAAVTTPLDVVKTLLNTQQHKVKGMFAGIKMVYKVSGLSGFWKGLSPRVMYQMPSTAICWTVYEVFKYNLSPEKFEVKCNDKSLSPTVLVSDRQKSKLGPVLLLPEVSLEPIKTIEQNKIFDNFITIDCQDMEFKAESWRKSLPASLTRESIENHGCEGKLLSNNTFERTNLKNPKWIGEMYP